MNVWLLLVLFVAPIVVGCVMGIWQWWKPQHDLDRLFRERRRERVAVERLPLPPPVSEPLRVVA